MTVKLRRYVPVYRKPIMTGSWEYFMGARTFETKKEAATLPRGPNVPAGLQVVAALPVSYTLKK